MPGQKEVALLVEDEKNLKKRIFAKNTLSYNKLSTPYFVMKRFIFVFFALGVFNTICAQKLSPDISHFIEERDAIYALNKSTGYLNFVGMRNAAEFDLTLASPNQSIDKFLEKYGFLFGVKSGDIEMQFLKKTHDTYGYRHYYFQQLYHGIPVFGGDFRLHFGPSGGLKAANGVIIPKIKCNTNPIINKSEALQLAKNKLHSKYNDNSTLNLTVDINLVIYHQGLLQGYKGHDYLAYYILLHNESGSIRSQVLVDAIKGAVLVEFSDIHPLSREIYNTNLSNLIWQEGDPFPGALNIYQQNEVAAAGHIYHLFNNAFGWLSYDGADAIMKTIHDNPGISCPNANWNGTTTNYCTNTSSDDVVAHEWGHAYTEYTSQLIYGWQTGALNESYSDIWGETVDLLNGYEDAGEDLSLRGGCGSSLRWMMGEDAGGFGGAIRDMWSPTCKGDPGKVSDAQYYCGTGDSGGVHTNSGVSNHAYALLVDGGSYNGQTITGLGFTKAAHIYWRSQAFYLTNTSDFSVQAAALEMACNDLLGINLLGLSTTSTPAGPSGEIMTASDCSEVTKVNAAVEFTSATPCGFSPMLDPATPAICSGGTSAQTIFFDDFESGIGSWTVTQHPSNPPTWDNREWSIQGSLPRSRNGHAIVAPDPVIGDCNTDLDNGLIRLESPVISIPGTISGDIKLSFTHYASLENKWDGGNIKYRINGGSWAIIPSANFIFNAYNDLLNASNDNPMAGEAAFTGADGGSVSGNWGESQINLSGLGLLPGDDLQLRWEMGTDGCNGWDAWYVDDILVCSCETVLPVTLSKFDAFAKSNYIKIWWQTETELNNLGFYLQRRELTEQNFENITWVSKHNSANQNYEYIDKNVVAGKTYFYRLAQRDTDGKLTYSSVVNAKLNAKQSPIVYPNPVRNEFFIDYKGNPFSRFQIDLIGINGLVIKKWSYSPENTTVRLKVQEVPKGIYLLRMKNADNIWMQKLIVD